jgi:hypothetical protein
MTLCLAKFFLADIIFVTTLRRLSANVLELFLKILSSLTTVSIIISTMGTWTRPVRMRCIMSLNWHKLKILWKVYQRAGRLKWGREVSSSVVERNKGWPLLDAW